MHLAVIQDIPTPHNNVLLAAAAADKDTQLTLWYCTPHAAKYDFKADLANAIQPARFYSPRLPDLKFLLWCLCQPRDVRFLIVGWMNINTRLLMLLFWLLRRPYNVWFDLPQDDTPRSLPKKLLRNFFYGVLKTSRAHVFCVGHMTVEAFKAREFSPDRLTNLPIFVDITEDKATFGNAIPGMRKKYGATDAHLLLSTGSRLVHDKGYDVFVAALALLSPEERTRIKAVLIGKGPEEEALKAQAEEADLGDLLTFEGWMEFEDFKALIAASDLFIHPARFDAFGGTIFAHTLGTPVIGSVGAGAALDRVQHGVNGWLYEADSPEAMVAHIRHAFAHQDSLAAMSLAARATAEAWSPEHGVKIIKDESI
ncbi:MAG: hypothetical protein COY40_05715 [Alphaproteobacteria bacterium CG_4_10_14_0_8_um_filter_53_9]|nr:MAG: hypothetical protein COY40_05715 [Alphaproteobacteria bacterium CG_4_10_14_0_8_um_filter_53_9]